MNPIDFEDLYDKIVLSGTPSPGTVKLSGHDRGQKVDIKDADGSGGGTTTYKGEKVGKFRATFTLVKGDQNGVEIDEFLEWQIFKAILRQYTRGDVAAEVYHPDLSDNDFSAVTVETIGGMVHKGGGLAEVFVDFVEFLPPKPKTKSPSGTKKKQNDPNAAAKAEIDALLKEAAAP